MTPTDRSVLLALAEWFHPEDWRALPFKSLQRATGLDRRAVRLSCRRLARKGLAAFEKGLWTEDGDPAGSGYRVTEDGYEAASTRPAESVDDAPGRNPK